MNKFIFIYVLVTLFYNKNSSVQEIERLPIFRKNLKKKIKIKGFSVNLRRKENNNKRKKK